METNRIIDELKAVAGLDWNPEQKAYYEQRAKDARIVQCVRMCDVFTPAQIRFFGAMGWKTQKKMCYRNAAELITTILKSRRVFPDIPPVMYVEGYVYSYGLLPIEHAFVKVGDKYIDPTIERALHRDVRKEMYASLIELGPGTMIRYQAETGYYGDLYQYDYLRTHKPELAAHIRAMNPHRE